MVFFSWVTPALAAVSTKDIRTNIYIILGIVALTIISGLGEMILEALNKGKIKLYVGIISTLMVLMIVMGYFVACFAQLVSTSKMF